MSNAKAKIKLTGKNLLKTKYFELKDAPVVEATPSAADCEDLAKAKEACLAEGGVSSNILRASTISWQFYFTYSHRLRTAVPSWQAT